MRTFFFSLLLFFNVSNVCAEQAADERTKTLSGELSVFWSEVHHAAQPYLQRHLYLTAPGEKSIKLAINPRLEPRINRILQTKPRPVVAVSIATTATERAIMPAAEAQSVIDLSPISATPRDHAPPPSVKGSQPWLTLGCKFADVAAEPKSVGYFQNMYGDNFGGLNHFWREVSYNSSNLNGSTAVAWVTLPQAESFYIPANLNVDWDGLFAACAAAADSQVFFPDYEGVNLMFNTLFGCPANIPNCCYSVGGEGNFITLDGVSRRWRQTFNNACSAGQHGIIAHEMGHGYGLPHSNNADGDNNPYDNPWDLMSDSFQYAVQHATYGSLGKHHNSYHKNLLDWIPAEQNFTLSNGGSFPLALDFLTEPSTSNFRMVTIPTTGDRFYTVEARGLDKYDAGLPGEAVIIHEIDPSRVEPAWVVDPSAADYADTPSTMWQVGETFSDPANGIAVTVNAATATGFDITVSSNAAANYSTVWWDQNQSGQGIQILDNGSQLTGAWYVYDEQGVGTWVTFLNSFDGSTANFDLQQFTGPALGSAWDTSLVINSKVGTASIVFTSALSATFNYTLNGKSGSLNLTPFDTNATGIYTKVWWNPLQSGQGVQVLHSGNTISGAWYLYDEQGIDMWVTFLGQLSGTTVTSDLVQFTGPRLGAAWNTAQVQAIPIGTVTINFQSATSATFNYTLKGVSGSLNLDPFPF